MSSLMTNGNPPGTNHTTTPTTFSVPQPIESVAQASKVPGYAVDVATLLASYKTADSFSFSEFKKLWKNKKFSLIHKGKPIELEDYEYLNALYCISFCYLLLPTPLTIRIGVLYFVYLLYDTQHHSPKLRIPMTFGVWKEFQKLFEEIKEKKLVDAYHVFAHLHRNNYISYVAHIRIAPLSTTPSSHFHRNIDDFLESVNSDRVTQLLDLQQLKEISKNYHQSKALVAGASVSEQQVGGEEEARSGLLNRDSSLPPSLNVANSLLFEELQELIDKYERERFLRHPAVPPTTILALNYANLTPTPPATRVSVTRTRKGRPPLGHSPPSSPSPARARPRGRPKKNPLPSQQQQQPQQPQQPPPEQSAQQQEKGKEIDDEQEDYREPEEEDFGELQHMPSLPLAITSSSIPTPSRTLTASSSSSSSSSAPSSTSSSSSSTSSSSNTSSVSSSRPPIVTSRGNPIKRPRTKK